MSRVIRISKNAFAQIQGQAVPLVDTPGKVVDRVLKEHAELKVLNIEMLEALNKALRAWCSDGKDSVAAFELLEQVVAKAEGQGGQTNET